MFWDSKFGKDKICGITQTRLRSGKGKDGLPYVITLKCKHSFYRKALISWYISNISRNLSHTCPLCRSELITV